MQRITITIDDNLLDEVDRHITARGYQNRSEAIRDLVRTGLQETEDAGDDTADCVAALAYVYDHSARELARRLVQSFHEHHDLALATLHVHLDHDTCMEVTVLRGATHEVRYVAEHVMAERGVRHGRLMTVPVAIEDQHHAHSHEPSRTHLHTRVRN